MVLDETEKLRMFNAVVGRKPTHMWTPFAGMFKSMVTVAEDRGYEFVPPMYDSREHEITEDLATEIARAARDPEYVGPHPHPIEENFVRQLITAGKMGYTVKTPKTRG